MSKKKRPIRFGSHEYMVARKREIAKQEARLNYKDMLKIYLSFSLAELKEIDHPLYEIIKRTFPNLDENATVADARTLKLLDKAIREGSQKSIELTYKLDGSMSDLTVEPNFDELDEVLKGVKWWIKH